MVGYVRAKEQVQPDDPLGASEADLPYACPLPPAEALRPWNTVAEDTGSPLQLEAVGYACCRFAASLGALDIAGVSRRDVVLVQVTTRNWPVAAEMEMLALFRVPANCRRLLLAQVHFQRKCVDSFLTFQNNPPALQSTARAAAAATAVGPRLNSLQALPLPSGRAKIADVQRKARAAATSGIRQRMRASRTGAMGFRTIARIADVATTTPLPLLYASAASQTAETHETNRISSKKLYGGLPYVPTNRNSADMTPAKAAE